MIERATVGNAKKFKGVEKDGERTCTKCMQSKVLNRFNKSANHVGGRYPWCKNCQSKHHKNWYAEKTGRSLDQIRVIRKLKIIDGKKLCVKCGLYKASDMFYKNASASCGLEAGCKECKRNYSVIINRINKMEFILAYGGGCSCCGITDLDLLTVEHIKYKGHKLIYNQTDVLMRKLKALKYPEGYTCLCFNCNLSTKSGRPCPHSKEYNDYEKKLELFLEKDHRKGKYFKLKYKLIG